MDRVDCIVIGAGVVGLAVARELAMSGAEVVIIEAEDLIGSVTSARNSEVIHAGIYYEAGSAKARHCVQGRDLLYAYCAERGVPHARCGKLIVATSADQRDALDAIRAKAAANGVTDLQPVTRAQAIALEPNLECAAALLSPSTGIVDSHALMHSLLGDAQAHGAMLALKSRVVAGECRHDGIALQVASDDGPMQILADTVINAAGLAAPKVAAALQGFPHERLPRPYFAKGNYYGLSGRSPFSRLIYPVPEPGGLGIHLTIDLGGQARFGPDVEWLSIDDPAAIRYDVDPARAERFYAAIRRYWPALPDAALQASYSGVRPKLVGPGSEGDFVIQGPAEHGVPRLVNLFGIESPGLTAALSLAPAVRLALQSQPVGAADGS
ncbi:MAG: NAD(P)/FAD-dependent oxidoreductase [Burkholderiales bacterium]|nr:NAD(P)/FAD-dependent oxidoreductase [Burkholderiales bacterium]